MSGFLSGMRQSVGRPEGGDHWYNRWGYTPGQIAANLALRVGGGLVLGPFGARLGGMVGNYYANHHNPNNPANPANPGYVDPGSLQGPGFHPDFGSIDHTIPPVQVGGGAGGGYTPGNPDLSAGGWQSGYGAGGYSGGGQSGSGGGFVPSTTTLNPLPGYTPPDWSSFLNPPDLNVQTGNGGGSGGGGQHAGGMGGGNANGGGMATGGTLGGGTTVDPSAWGQFGLGGDSGPASGGVGADYARLLMSGGMHEAGGGGPRGGAMASFLAGRRPGAPAQPGVGNTGIVPPAMRTGGGGPVAAQVPGAPPTMQTLGGMWLNGIAGRPLRAGIPNPPPPPGSRG